MEAIAMGELRAAVIGAVLGAVLGSALTLLTTIGWDKYKQHELMLPS